MGEARPLKLQNIAAWLISTCLHICPFCLCLGDHALVPCVLTPCAYMQRQRWELVDKQWKEKMQKYNLSKRERKEEGRIFKRVHNQMGEARPLKQWNIVAWLISTCLHLRPFCLCLGNHALVPCVLAPCAYMQRQRRELADKQWKEKMQRAYERGIKRISMIDMKAKKQESKQTSEKTNKRES